MLVAKLVRTLMAITTSLFAFEGEILDDPTLYRSMIGALQYLYNKARHRIHIEQALPISSKKRKTTTNLHWQYVECGTTNRLCLKVCISS